MIKNTSAILEALRVAANDEKSAVEFLEQQRWGNMPGCPHCGDVNVYKMTGRDGKRNKDYRWRCRGCGEMFTVRTKTVFAETRLPLRIWVYAFWKACSSKKGISALQLSREMEITHKSSLFILRRIRHGLGLKNPVKLSGTVEADEVYAGGKPRYKFEEKRGRGSSKIPVLGIVQRGGDVRFQAVKRLTSEKVAKFILDNAELSSRLMTDQLNAYKNVGRKFKGGHHAVKHHMRQYVKPGTDWHSNTIEGVFSLIRRGVMGTWHSISTKHLPNYLNEFEFRWNTRMMNDGQRVHAAIKAIEGKRLEYRESVEHPPYFLS